MGFVAVVEGCIDPVYCAAAGLSGMVGGEVRIVTILPGAPDFFPPSPNWLKQPNIHSFLENQKAI